MIGDQGVLNYGLIQKAALDGLGLERRGQEWKIVVPDRLRIGHDAHFRELTKGFLARIEHTILR